MAKKYHPDLHPDDPQAAERMNEINQAYDMLSNPEKYRQPQNGYGGGTTGYGYGNPFWDYANRSYGGYKSAGENDSQRSYGYGTFYGFDFDDIFGFGGRSTGYRRTPPGSPAHQAGDSQELKEAVDFINMGEYTYASGALNRVLSADRDARWCYLYALTNYGLGSTVLALEQIRKAMQLDPDNAVYKETYDNMAASGSYYTNASSGYRTYSMGFGRFFFSMCLAQICCAFCRCF